MQQKLQPGDLVHIEVTPGQADQLLPPLVKLVKIHGGEAEVRINAYGDTKTVHIDKCTFVDHGLPVGA